jgi:hypothetical protein
MGNHRDSAYGQDEPKYQHNHFVSRLALLVQKPSAESAGTELMAKGGRLPLILAVTRRAQMSFPEGCPRFMRGIFVHGAAAFAFLRTGQGLLYIAAILPASRCPGGDASRLVGR